MAATSLDLSQIKTDALSSAATFRSLIGLGTLATVTPTGTPDGTKFLRDDNSWQAVNLSAYLPLAGGTLTGALTITQGTANTSVLTSTGYSLTGSNAQSLMDLAGTWNTTGTPTLVKAYVTNTASNTSSLLLDVGLGGGTPTPAFQVRVDGRIRFGTSALYAPLLIPSDGLFSVSRIDAPTSSYVTLGSSSVAGVSLNLGGGYYWSSSFTNSNVITGGTPAAALICSTANYLEQRVGTNAQTYRIYNTFTSATSFENLQFQWASNEARIGTSVGSAGGTQRNLVLGAWNSAGTWTAGPAITSAGRMEFGTIAASANAPLRIQSDGAGRCFVLSSTSAEYCELVLGGVVKGFLCQGSVPFTLSNAGDIFFQTNSVERFRISSTGLTTLADAVNIAIGTTTGTKIGTGTTQKIGFFNATPVVQQTAVADATDAASVITQLNALLTRMRNLGLIAT